MAFVRKKVHNGVAYYPIVESCCNQEKVKQRTLEHLGSEKKVSKIMIKDV